MRLYRQVSRKRYYGYVYEYERFYLPIPKRYNNIVKTFVGVELKVEVKEVKEGFIVEAKIKKPALSILEVLGVQTS